MQSHQRLPPLGRQASSSSPSTTQAPEAVDWDAVQKQAIRRNDLAYPCAICQEPFLASNRGSELLLSCSHVFHEACLTSYERYVTSLRPTHAETIIPGSNTGNKPLACPVCRCADYKKRRTSMVEGFSRQHAAVKIQAVWRGYRQRTIYRHHRELNPPKDALLRQKWVEDKLHNKTRSLVVQVQDASRHIDNLLDSVDVEQMRRQQIMDSLVKQLEQMDPQKPKRRIKKSLPPAAAAPGVNWSAAYQQCLERMPSECSICIGPLFSRGPTAARKQKPLYLLSCTHVFHQPCLDSFELFRLADLAPATRRADFSVSTESLAQLHCPICRTVYEKLSIS
ncbi:RING finger protein 32 [Sorochytrium milnesiophthora]